MKLVTAVQMREIEKTAIERYNISGLIMMENAAISFCNILIENCELENKKIGIYCGKGNNGGDGFAIARQLVCCGYSVTIVKAFDDEDNIKGDALINYKSALNMGIKMIDTGSNHGDFDVLIDAVLGTGFSGELRGKAIVAAEEINESRGFKAAVDMPTGCDASNGKASQKSVKADMTVTFCLAKYGQFFYPAKYNMGKIFVAPISVPPDYLSEFESGLYLIDESIMEMIPKRKETSHKGSCGRVCVFAGSKGMSGACIMSSGAALKAGAGVITAVTDNKTAELLVMRYPEIMTKTFDNNKWDVLSECIAKCDVVLAGCGIGVNDENKEIMKKLIKSCEIPLVIDADGITNICGDMEILKERKAPIILTPHVGEFSRMTGMSVKEIEENRFAIAGEFAKKYGVILILKGANTVCSDENGKMSVLGKANPALSVAGSGDALAGITASLIAQGVKSADAAASGVYIHSKAGFAAAEKQGIRGVTTSDIIDNITCC